MDHKVSKDMISSGMIPSGEKTQADLGRIQYGSAPSPSSLMDAYKSIYEHHQKDANGNVIEHDENPRPEEEIADDLAPSSVEDINEVKEEQVDESLAGLAARGLMAGARGARVAGKLAAQGAVRARQMQASGGFRKAAGAAAQKVGQAAKGVLSKPGVKGGLVSGGLAGAATGAMVAGAMGGGKKKETNNRGLIPVKGYSSYDMKFDYTPEGDLISEDLFDALKTSLIEEGCDEKNVMKIMASVTPDYFNEIIQEENIDEAVVTGSILAGLAAKKLLAGALVKKGAALAAKSIAKKGLMGAAKAGSKAFGAGLKKGVMTAGKTAGKSITTSGGKVVGGAGKVKQATGLAGAGQKTGAFVRAGGAAAVNNPMMTGLTAMQAPSVVQSFRGGPKMPTMPAQQRAASAGKRTAGGLRMDLDLFDVVKGKLLDEGLTEEECTEVMTTLTLDEIQEGLGQITLGQIAGGAAKAAMVGGGAALAYQGAKKLKKMGDDALNKARDQKGGNKRVDDIRKGSGDNTVGKKLYN